MTYYDDLKHPTWQKYKSEIFKRDKFKCRCCKSAEITLHAHHLYYLPNTKIWDYDKDAVVTVCEKCHEILTKELPKIAGHIAFKILSSKIKNLSDHGRK